MLFFDFEFHPSTFAPISFGLTNEHGRSLYVEFDIRDADLESHPFLMDTVAPLLGMTPEAVKIPVSQLPAIINEYLGRQAPQAVKFICDYDVDRELLERHYRKGLDIEVFIPHDPDESIAFEDSYAAHHDDILSPRHHALHDAFALKSAYQLVMNSRGGLRNA